MARFKNSNSIAMAQMTYLGAKKQRKPVPLAREQSYFRSIGFDHAMI